jgi:hypothetical protein
MHLIIIITFDEVNFSMFRYEQYVIKVIGF